MVYQTMMKRKEFQDTWNEHFLSLDVKKIHQGLRDSLKAGGIKYKDKKRGLIVSETPVNVGFIPILSDKYLTSVISVLSETIRMVLPELYKSERVHPLLGEYTIFLDQIKLEALKNDPFICGIDCRFDPDANDLKIYEFNMNAVVGLGYMERNIESWNSVILPHLNKQIPKGEFRPLANDFWKPLIEHYGNLYILVDKDSPHKQEENTQAKILSNVTGCEVRLCYLDELFVDSQINKISYGKKNPTEVNLLKRAISGSLMAFEKPIFDKILILEKTETKIINPLAGFIIGSKLTNYLILGQEFHDLIWDRFEGSNAEKKRKLDILSEILPDTWILINDKVFRTDGQVNSIDAFLENENRKDWTIKDCFGGGFRSKVYFGSGRMTQTKWKEIIWKCSKANTPWALQKYLPSTTGIYLCFDHEKDAINIKEQRELTRLYFGKDGNRYWGVMCVGERKKLNFASKIVPLYFQKT